MEIQPQTIYSGIIDQLNTLSPDRRHNPFVLNRFRQEAEKLKNVNLAFAFSALGVISTLERNIQDVRKNFDLSLSHARERYTSIYLNYAVSLGKLGYLSEAEKVLQTAYNIFRYDLKILESLMEYSILSGKLRQAYNLIEDWIKLSPNTMCEIGQIIIPAAQEFNKLQYPDDLFENYFAAITKIFRDENLFIASERIISNDGSKPTLYNQYYIDAPGIEINRITETIDSAIKEFPTDLKEFFYFDLPYPESDIENLIVSVEKDIEIPSEKLVDADESQLRRLANLVGLDVDQWL